MIVLATCAAMAAMGMALGMTLVPNEPVTLALAGAAALGWTVAASATVYGRKTDDRYDRLCRYARTLVAEKQQLEAEIRRPGVSHARTM